MNKESTEQQLQTRRRFLAYFGGVGLSSTLLPGVLWAKLQEAESPEITIEMIREAARLAGLELTEAEQKEMVEGVNKVRRELGIA